MLVCGYMCVSNGINTNQNLYFLPSRYILIQYYCTYLWATKTFHVIDMQSFDFDLFFASYACESEF